MRPTKGFQQIWIELYGVNVYWIVCPREEYSLRVKKEFDEQVPIKNQNVAGTYECYTKKEQPISTIWLSPKADAIVVAHECFHATHDILQTKGLWLTDASEEAYTYLIQYLMCKILVKRKQD